MSSASGIGSLQQSINSITPSETKAVQAGAPGSKVAEGATSVVDVQQGDRANLSSTGGLVGEALASSDVRSAKVAALQQAIADGSYSVSSSDVADKIIQSLLS
jgi:negative regulator of flagellin synthesis FlgM